MASTFKLQGPPTMWEVMWLFTNDEQHLEMSKWLADYAPELDDESLMTEFPWSLLVDLGMGPRLDLLIPEKVRKEVIFTLNADRVGLAENVESLDHAGWGNFVSPSNLIPRKMRPKMGPMENDPWRYFYENKSGEIEWQSAEPSRKAIDLLNKLTTVPLAVTAVAARQQRSPDAYVQSRLAKWMVSFLNSILPSGGRVVKYENVRKSVSEYVLEQRGRTNQRLFVVADLDAMRDSDTLFHREPNLNIAQSFKKLWESGPTRVFWVLP